MQTRLKPHFIRQRLWPQSA